ncbi:MAG: hypothetical protein AAF790_09020 [Planctomycetota bacterium]
MTSGRPGATRTIFALTLAAASAGCATNQRPLLGLAALPLAVVRGAVADANEQQLRREGNELDAFAWEQRAGSPATTAAQ